MSFMTDLAYLPKIYAQLVLTERNNQSRHLAAMSRLDVQIELLKDIRDILRFFAPGEAVVLELVFINSATGETQTIKHGENMIFPRNSTVVGTIKVYDSTDPATRNETTLDGAPEITLTPGPIDPNVSMTIDGLTVTLVSNAKAGAALLTVNGDAKIGDGVTPISFTADINVPAGEAVVGEVVFSDPTTNP